MSINYGPKIPQTNLALCLDCNNTNSYPGSGTSWVDLVRGLNFTCYNTLTPFTTKLNIPCFAFNSSGYWMCGTPNVDMAGDYTIIMWYFHEYMSIRRNICEKLGTTYASYQQELAMTIETSNRITCYSRWGTNYDYGYINGLIQDQWQMMSFQRTSGKTTAPSTGKYSVNGNAYITDYLSRSTTAIVPAGNLRFGAGYAGIMDVGAISMALVYEKILTDEEIKQIYNSTKGRFGHS